MKNKMI